MYDCYIFDFDYTLVDSSEGIVGCFNLALNAIGHEPVKPDEIKATIGLPMRDAVARILNDKDDNLFLRFMESYMPFADEFMTRDTHFYPETLPMLRTLKKRGAKTAIVSSKTSARILEKFQRDNVTELIDIIIGTQEVKNLKPDPEGVLLVMEKFKTAPEKTIYVGDSAVDAETALRAGVPFVGVLTGVTEEKVLRNFENVAILKNLSRIPEL